MARDGGQEFNVYNRLDEKKRGREGKRGEESVKRVEFGQTVEHGHFHIFLCLGHVS